MEYLVSLEQLQEIENLELLAKQVVEGFIIGLHKSPYHGFSVEFAEHRLYNQGESTKNIDWKVFARTDRLYTKQYEEETNLRCQIVIDASSSMYFPKGKKEANKIKFSVVCSAAIIHLLKQQRDAFGLSIFSDKVEFQSKARSSILHQKRIQSELTNLLERDELNLTTNAAESLHLIAENTHKRSLIMLFSDMFDHLPTADSKEREELYAALQHLKYRKHEVVLFHVVDKKQELDFEFENRPYLFVDMETGEKVKVNTNAVKDSYVKQVKAFQDELMLKCNQYQIDYVQADINKHFKQVLLPYIVKRSKMY